MRKRRQFYIPNVDMWRFDRMTDTFLEVQYKRCRESYDQTENALGLLDERVNALMQAALEGWPAGTPQLRQKVEEAMKEIRDERKRIADVQGRLVSVMDRLHAEIKGRRRRFA